MGVKGKEIPGTIVTLTNPIPSELGVASGKGGYRYNCGGRKSRIRYTDGN